MPWLGALGVHVVVALLLQVSGGPSKAVPQIRPDMEAIRVQAMDERELTRKREAYHQAEKEREAAAERKKEEAKRASAMERERLKAERNKRREAEERKQREARGGGTQAARSGQGAGESRNACAVAQKGRGSPAGQRGGVADPPSECLAHCY